MSATNSGADRVAHDAYETPQRLARELVGLLPIAPGSVVLEPSAGRGSFVRGLRATGLPMEIEAVEVRPLCRVALREAGADRVWCADFGRWTPEDPACMGAPWRHGFRFDWAVGNPPFSLAEEHVRRCLSFVCEGGHVAMLLRTGFLESVERILFWSEYRPRFFWTLSERPPFVGGGGGTDAACYSFFWWTRGWSGTTGHDHLFRWKRDGQGDSRRAAVSVLRVPFLGDDQLRLPLSPDIPEIVDVDREGLTQAERYEEFIRHNLGLFHAYHRMAVELKRQGWRRGSISLLTERIRWLYAIRTKGSTFKIDNRFRAYLSRTLMVYEPELDGFFETRKQLSGDWEPDLARLGLAGR